jgi:hypothetical protein
MRRISENVTPGRNLARIASHAVLIAATIRRSSAFGSPSTTVRA